MTVRPPTVRAAEVSDDDAIMAIASTFDLDGSDSVQSGRYRSLVRRRGRLLVATVGGEVVGFGGMIVVPHDGGPVAMITDLFVAPEHHGFGAGRLIAHALVDGHDRRMTFTSRHPAARHVYASLGMRARWSLRYLRGGARGTPSPLVAWAVDPVTVAGDRREYLELLDPIDCHELLAGGEVVGHAIGEDDGELIVVHRLATTADHGAAIRALLAACPPGRIVELCVPATSAASAALDELGFEEYDHDVHLSTEPGLIPSTVAVVNPGLA